jgi:tRNA G18 (ribose-2'-O)-methylase SpoU
MKTSLGATESVAWESVNDIESVITRLQTDEVSIVAVEQHMNAKPYTDVSYTTDVAFIFGNEVEGVPLHICEGATHIVHITMHGKKESLNVGVAAGIILFDARNRGGGGSDKPRIW